MSSEVAAAGEPFVLSQQEIDDIRALSKRHAETGEFFSYDPATRQAEVYKPIESPHPVSAIHVGDLSKAPSRPPLVHPPPRRQFVAPATRHRERKARSRSSSPSRGDPDDGEADHLRVIPYATFRRVLRHALGEQA